MHGRLKVITTEEQKFKKQHEQHKKLVAYRDGVQHILQSRRRHEYDDESLKICSKILSQQPDVYTLWNYRKEAILKRLENEGKVPTWAEDLSTYLEEELLLTQQSLMANPKSYSSWHHRYWILNRHPNPDWQKELTLCSQYIALDERNFHCWDYRRLILKHVGVALVNEIAFSTEYININFSNYSSWHYRSTLKFLDIQNIATELTLLESAVYTDPYDSSPWFYLKWVLSNPCVTEKSRNRFLQQLDELWELEPLCKWIAIAKCWLSSDPNEKLHLHDTLANLDGLRKGCYLELENTMK